jgi:UTP-glucose-1-phosphate uridylyltransferase
VYAYEFAGTHYDAGSKVGLLKASLAYALKDCESEQGLRECLATLESLEGAKFH